MGLDAAPFQWVPDKAKGLGRILNWFIQGSDKVADRDRSFWFLSGSDGVFVMHLESFAYVSSRVRWLVIPLFSV